jgi:hypothetical protein
LGEWVIWADDLGPGAKEARDFEAEFPVGFMIM